MFCPNRHLDRITVLKHSKLQKSSSLWIIPLPGAMRSDAAGLGLPTSRADVLAARPKCSLTLQPANSKSTKSQRAGVGLETAVKLKVRVTHKNYLCQHTSYGLECLIFYNTAKLLLQAYQCPIFILTRQSNHR